MPGKPGPTPGEPTQHKDQRVNIPTQKLRQFVEDTDKEAKVSTARDPWVPPVNNEGAFGRWAFLEVLNSRKCEKEIRDLVLSLRENAGDGSKARAAGAVAWGPP